jgi:hypothetical protein
VRGLRLKGAWAIDHQVVNGIAREDRLHGDGVLWTLADGVSIPVPRAMQFVVGGSLDVQGVLMTLDAYTKEFDDVTLFAPRLYPGMAPAPGSSLFYNGSGRARDRGADSVQSAAKHDLGELCLEPNRIHLP